MNKTRLKARAKADALETGYAIFLITVFFGVFGALQAAANDSTTPLATAGIVIVSFGAASLINTFLAEALTDLRTRLRNAVAATSSQATKASTDDAS